MRSGPSPSLNAGPGVPPRAEYHPGAGWLRANGRDAAMVKGVEFTNIRTFEAEARRMPNFALHELAHAYHDRVLGFENPEIEAAYQRALAAGATAVSPPGQKPWGQTVAFVRDKDGIVVEICSPSTQS